MLVTRVVFKKIVPFIVVPSKQSKRNHLRPSIVLVPEKFVLNLLHSDKCWNLDFLFFLAFDPPTPPPPKKKEKNTKSFVTNVLLSLPKKRLSQLNTERESYFLFISGRDALLELQPGVGGQESHVVCLWLLYISLRHVGWT